MNAFKGGSGLSMGSLKNNLLYAGLSKDEFAQVKPEAIRENSRNLSIYTPITMAFFIILTIANRFITSSSTENGLYYACIAGISAILFVASNTVLPKHQQLVMPSVYVYILSLCAFSFAVTMQHPALPAVTAIVMLVLVPFLFIDRPISVLITLGCMLAVFCALVLCYKDQSVIFIDIWNAITFAVIALVAVLFHMRTRFRMLHQGRRIRYISITDLLTGVHNRNCYETRLHSYVRKCSHHLVCVFVDVNGLHELNDTQGHHAGDVMLQSVANSLIRRFGDQDTYRIGGDEFVVLCPDGDNETIEKELKDIAAELSRQGYSISIGIASGDKNGLDPEALAKQAEALMYVQKSAYYQQAGHDRRSR